MLNPTFEELGEFQTSHTIVSKSSNTAKLQRRNAARLQGCRAARLQGCKASDESATCLKLTDEFFILVG
jgi:hypothetical protein